MPVNLRVTQIVLRGNRALEMIERGSNVLVIVQQERVLEGVWWFSGVGHDRWILCVLRARVKRNRVDKIHPSCILPS